MPLSLPLDIEMIRYEQKEEILPELATLLQDCVIGGASIGFLLPFSEEEARAFWIDVFDDVRKGKRILLVLRKDGVVVGTAQLELVQKPNGRHRAEVQKVLVSQSQRRQGIAQRLMAAIEQVALAHQRTLLVLDTWKGEPSEYLYRKVGYIEVGAIPDFAFNTSGELHPTVVFYKILSDHHS